jgi:uncharacterized protein (DUF1501 family)
MNHDDPIPAGELPDSPPPADPRPEAAEAPPLRRLTTRRGFLAAAGALGIAGAGGATLFEIFRNSSTTSSRTDPATSATTTPPGTAATGGAANGILVLVTLYGGNDGLNTLVPYSNSAYVSARGDLAIHPDEVLALDNELGLNPGLTGFKKLWDAKQLAIVRGVGYPNPNRSHFRSMDIWQSGVPDRDEPTGWLGRWLDTTDRDPMQALAIGTTLPRALRGKNTAAGVVPAGKFTLPASATLDAGFRNLATTTSTDGSLSAAIQQANHDLITVQQRLAAITAADSAAGGGNQSLEPSANLPTTNPLAAQLAVVSQAIRNAAPTRVYSVSLGGFDTHATERAAHIQLHRTLGDAVAGFLASIDGHPAAANVVVMIYSEFGRRVAANASGGTDHGTAAPLFVAGPNVRGGYYGDQPSLTDLDQGDVKYNVDFRSVYATVLDRALTTDPAKILGNTFPTLPML